jgi:hypothetical protein
MAVKVTRRTRDVATNAVRCPRTFSSSPASHAGDEMRKQVQPRRVRVAANGRARAAARLVLQELRARQPVRAMPCCSEPLLLCPVALTLWLVACCTPCGMLYDALRNATRYAARCLPCAILRAAMPQTLSLRVRVRAQSAHACACDRESLRVQVCALARGCARVGCSSSARLRVAQVSYRLHVRRLRARQARISRVPFSRPSRTLRVHTRVPTRA